MRGPALPLGPEFDGLIFQLLKTAGGIKVLVVCRQAELLPPPPAGLILQDLAQSPWGVAPISWGCWWLLACPHVAFRVVVPVLPSILLELITRKGKAS